MTGPGTTCPSCGAEISGADRFCAACGTSLTLGADAPTLDAPPTPRQPVGSSAHSPPTGGHVSGTSQASWLSSSSSTAGARFAPGTILAGRYRVIGLLGKGGMGEVYRADDLTLDQPVALKLLPEALAKDADRRARFLGEVRTARQVTHPNVCRVHDIGEIDGLLYLSMEYVDGEDLSSLLRRIGRLPGDKAIEIARQLCAGLAAAHDKGVLHRDLKPANVMIDGEGKVRLTDFGLAAAVRDLKDGDARVGTPAYMSPEQLTGKTVTQKSDIYAVGLVLYELLTGRRAFEADTLGELTAMHTSTPVDSPSSVLPEMDPTIEAVILRCLEKNPEERPSSALAVAAALPGGDPLAAALAAGETPSPELVAAAGETSALRPAIAWSLLAAFVGLLILYAALGDRAQLFSHVSPERSPDVLAAKARETLETVGYTDRPADTAHRFTVDFEVVNNVVSTRSTAPDYWRPVLDARPQPLFYWYRESPRSLVSDDPDGVVSYGDPPMNLSNMARVRFDMSGRLTELTVVPEQVIGSDMSRVSTSVDWSRLFALAGLDTARFVEIDPVWTPEFYADELRAWRGTYADATEDTVRVDAAAYGGRPTGFQVVGAWESPFRQVEPSPAGAFAFAQVMSLGIVVAVILLGAFLARRNLKLGRGDPKGAFRLAGFVGACNGIAWLLTANHPSSFQAVVPATFLAIGYTLFVCGLIWLVYAALEPYVRKRWPHRIVTWSRALSGRVRDPLVGRDVLIGSLVGVAVAVIDALHVIIPPKLGIGGALPMGTSFLTLLGAEKTVAVVLQSVGQAVINGLVFLFVPLVFFFIVRKEIIGVALFGLLLMGLWFPRSPVPAIALSVGVLQAGLWLGLMMRGGLLPLTVSFFTYFALMFAPVTLSFSTWYASSSIAALIVIAGVAVFGFVTAGGGRSLGSIDLIEQPARRPAG